MKYKFGGREKLLALGEWPHTSLKRARERREDAHRLLVDGIDPAAKRKAERAAIADTFSALEYLDTKRDSPEEEPVPVVAASDSQLSARLSRAMHLAADPFTDVAR